ncbi:MAG: galactose mutarotase [Firmicutes bacterium]|nr:galactose mutarotase [Bacillota bacterium]
MTIEQRPFGKTKAGETVTCYTLRDGGAEAEILTYGGAIRSLRVAAAEGVRDVALGFDSIEAYENQDKFIGALIGRVANRIGGARFTLDGVTYRLPANDGANCLHGGPDGFDKRVWSANTQSGVLSLSLFSPDGDAGFPGNLSVGVDYSLEGGALHIRYVGRCGMSTPLNLTNHCYFNLSGHSAGTIDGHSIQILADAVTEVDAGLIPTGKLLDVAGTPYDLRSPKTIGSFMFDDNFVLSREPQIEPRLAAVLESGGLRMECLTTEPGLQFYSGNFLNGDVGKGGAVYGRRSGLCLETQFWPDAVNHPDFPSCILRDGAVYVGETVYRFSQY